MIAFCPNLKWQRLAILVVVAVLLQEFPAFCSTEDFVDLVFNGGSGSGELGNKKLYDPRSYLALAETSMSERVKQAASDLRASGKTTFAS